MRWRASFYTPFALTEKAMMDKLAVPSRRAGCSGLRGTLANAVALLALRALAAYTDNHFVDESNQRWFSVCLREVTELLFAYYC